MVCAPIAPLVRLAARMGQAAGRMTQDAREAFFDLLKSGGRAVRARSLTQRPLRSLDGRLDLRLAVGR